jgi:hypothetical protein
LSGAGFFVIEGNSVGGDVPDAVKNGVIMSAQIGGVIVQAAKVIIV